MSWLLQSSRFSHTSLRLTNNFTRFSLISEQSYLFISSIINYMSQTIWEKTLKLEYLQPHAPGHKQHGMQWKVWEKDKRVNINLSSNAYSTDISTDKDLTVLSNAVFHNGIWTWFITSITWTWYLEWYQCCTMSQHGS